MFQAYTVALWGVFVILATLMLQSLIASMTKAKQPGAIPGKTGAKHETRFLL